MDSAQEQGMWRAIGEVEGQLEAMEKTVSRQRRTVRLLLVGLAIGVYFNLPSKKLGVPELWTACAPAANFAQQKFEEARR
jgi:hypothetical protein